MSALNRRELFVIAAALSAPPSAAVLTPSSGAEAARRLILLDPRVEAAQRARAQPARIIMLEGDLVPLWRRRLHAAIGAAGGAHAHVRWDKALMLCGLAREAGLRADTHAESKASFLVVLRPAARPAPPSETAHV